MERTTVPKFLTFKPKTKGDDAKAVGEHDAAILGASSQHSTPRASKQHDYAYAPHRSLTHTREHHDSSNSAEHHYRSAVATSKQAVPREVKEPGPFFADRQGDPKNIEYGSLHRYDVPAYRRSGFGYILGMPTAKIDRDASSDRAITLTRNRQRKVQTDQKLLTSKRWHAQDTVHRFINASDEICEGVNTDFIALRPPRNRKHASEFAQRRETHWDVDYRFVEGITTPLVLPHDEDVISDISDLDIEQRHNEKKVQSRAKHARLSAAVKANPSNPDVWLLFTAHQASLIRYDVDLSEFSTSERTTLAELRLSILADAVRHVTVGQTGRDRLLLTMVGEGSYVWKREKLAAKLTEYLQECPTSEGLWLKYLDLEQYHRQAFSFEHCKNAFLTCLRTLRRAQKGLISGDHAQVARTQVVVLSRLIEFLRDAGYDELATAAWQILLEYHFMRPQALAGISTEREIEALEEFWESEKPRIGEVDARGWRQFSSGKDRPERQRGRGDVNASPRTLRDAAVVELQLASQQWLPASTSDDSLSDPFRFVMFSDLSEMLASLGDKLPHVELLNAFLGFFGLPNLPILYAATEFDPSTGQILFTKSAPRNHELNEASVQSSQRQGQAKKRSQQETIDTLTRDGFCSIDLTPSGHAAVPAFADRVLSMLAMHDIGSDAIAEYHIAFRLHFYPELVSKTARGYLYKRSSGLRLPNACALAEARLGNGLKAQKLWLAALENRINIPGAQDQAILIWHSAVLFHVLGGDEATALKFLSTVSEDVVRCAFPADGFIDSSARKLRVIRELSDGFDRMLLRQQFNFAALYASCHAMLHYLTADHDLKGTLETYNRYGLTLESVGDLTIVELLEQDKAELILNHLKCQRPFGYVLVQNNLEKSVAKFPSNSLLLTARYGLAAHDRVRTILTEQKSARNVELTAVGWTAYIAKEMRRVGDHGASSNYNTVRAAFIHALLNEESPAKHASLLWFWWLDFEHDCALVARREDKDVSMQRLKRVFFDGLEHIPWVKHWILKGISMLPDKYLSDLEIKRVHQVMVDRGMRVRVEMNM